MRTKIITYLLAAVGALGVSQPAARAGKGARPAEAARSEHKLDRAPQVSYARWGGGFGGGVQGSVVPIPSQARWAAGWGVVRKPTPGLQELAAARRWIT